MLSSNIRNLPGLDHFLVSFEAGDLIFCEYEVGNICYILRSGEVRLFKVIGNVEKTIDFLCAGDFLGEMSLLLNGIVRTATAVVLQKCDAYALDRKDFPDVIDRIPDLRMHLLSLFARRINRLDRQSEMLNLNDIVARVSDALIMFAEKIDETGSKDKVVLPLNVEAVGTWAGLSSGTVRDALRRYVERGSMQLFPDHIVVDNLNELRRVVNSKRRSEAFR